MKNITSYIEYTSWASGLNKHFLFLYKSGSPVCECALSSLKETHETTQSDVNIGLVNLSEVSDIHSHFAINSLPALLFFDNGKHINTVKGCHTSGNYTTMMQSAVFQAKAASEGKSLKNVTVYSTPTCPWCTTLKNWLRKNNIPFTDIDVSRDQHAAEELVRRSGQQGVPQTEINGQIVVGFNQQRLKELLEIK